MNNQNINLGNSINRAPFRLAFLLIPLVLASFALSPRAQALLTPAPDGGYPNGNTAEGDGALFSLTTGTDNTATGYQALFSNIGGTDPLGNPLGNDNTAVGYQALFSNTIGYQNTANGSGALFSNTRGSYNTATGCEALSYNTRGGENTATGFQALNGNTTGSSNTAIGVDALAMNNNGSYNTATGDTALELNVSGKNNSAVGFEALNFNTTGSNNTASGVRALFRLNGSNNIALGYQAGQNLTSGNNNIDIGADGKSGDNNTIRIGTGTIQYTGTFIQGISGSAITGTAVVVNSNGRLGVASSSARFKDEVKPMDKASEVILALKPVTFRYKQKIDPERVPQFGLVAEQVAKVNPDLVTRDIDGKVFTVRYEAVNAMLLNEFLKEHLKVDELQSLTANQQAMIAKQQKQIETLIAGLQKVSDQVELSKFARHTAGRIRCDGPSRQMVASTP